jgi:hypothetical protein
MARGAALIGYGVLGRLCSAGPAFSRAWGDCPRLGSMPDEPWR